MEMDGNLFRSVMGSFATGVTIVTTRDAEDNSYAVTVNSFTSLSLNPPLVLFCLDNLLAGLQIFLDSRRFAINILSQDQETVSHDCATRGSDRSEWLTDGGVFGLPVVKNPLALIECELLETYPGGDHTILIGEVQHLSLSPKIDEDQPLLYYRGRYLELA